MNYLQISLCCILRCSRDSYTVSLLDHFCQAHNRSQKSRQPSHDLVYACEPNILHTALILPTFLCCNYSHVLHHLTTWLACQHSNRWNENGIRHLLKNYSLPCAKTSLGTRLGASYIMASSTTRYKMVYSICTSYSLCKNTWPCKDSRGCDIHGASHKCILLALKT